MFETVRNLFLPHHTNNHRAKLLHNSSLIILVILLLGTSLVATVVKKTHPDVLGVSYSISESDLINLVNVQRQANGQGALVENAQLDDAARRKAADMFAKNYWAHFAPDGSTSPWMFIKDAGYSYAFAGENLAKGFTDAPSIVNAWMNSPTHRENILSPNFKDEGFAIVPGTLQGEDIVLVVEMFGSQNSETAPSVSPEAENISPSPTIALTSPIPARVAGGQITPIPSPKAMVAKVKAAKSSSKPLIDVRSTAKGITTAGIVLILFVLIIDLIIVEQRNIPRFVGHNIDHIILISLFLLFVVLTLGGAIL